MVQGPSADSGVSLSLARTDTAERVAPEWSTTAGGVEDAIDPDAPPLALRFTQALAQADDAASREACAQGQRSRREISR